jgi:hypothetical protein
MPRDINSNPKAPASRRIPMFVGVVAVISVGFWLFGPPQTAGGPVVIRLAPSMP